MESVSFATKTFQKEPSTKLRFLFFTKLSISNSATQLATRTCAPPAPRQPRSRALSGGFRKSHAPTGPTGPTVCQVVKRSFHLHVLWCSSSLVQWGMQSTSGQCSAGTIVLPWPSPCRCNLRGQMVCTEEAMNDLNVGMVQIGIGYIPTVKEDHPSWANEQNG